MNALNRKETVHEMYAHSQRALECFEAALSQLKDARQAASRSCYGSASVGFFPRLSFRNDEEEIKNFRENLHREMWRSFVIGTPLGSLMDAEEKKKFDDDLNRSVPEPTPETVMATISRLAGEADMIFRRGLVNVFARFCRDYKSNDGFKFGDRIVINFGVTYEKFFNSFRLAHRADADLVDLDRVMHVLDGKQAPQHQDGLCAALRLAFQNYSSTGETEVQTEYWRAKFFKKGTIHLYPLRKDLHDKANKIIAEHFGEVLPAGHEAHKTTPDYQPRHNQTFKEDFFETPPEVARRLIDIAAIESGHLVLEPSAGLGGLAKFVPNNAVLQCFEINSDRAQMLREAKFNVRCFDFLQEYSNPNFDRVIMNPPFSNRQDVRHVLHALNFLKPNGWLFAIMSSSVQTRSDEITAHFRKVMRERGGWFDQLPEGSFKASGTMVNTVIACIPGDQS